VINQVHGPAVGTVRIDFYLSTDTESPRSRHLERPIRVNCLMHSLDVTRATEPRYGTFSPDIDQPGDITARARMLYIVRIFRDSNIA